MNPNIYKYAHTEYAQDAFIAWICDCYNHQTNQYKKKISERFIKDLLGVKIDFMDVIVETQESNIDILLTLTCQNKEKYYVIIEDKKYSSIHDNQLKKYIGVLNARGISNDHIFVVYYKTGHISRNPNWIYVNNHTFIYDTSVKSEYQQINELGNYCKGLAGLKICSLANIWWFFNNPGMSALIASSKSEILEDYADEIERQYKNYNGQQINAANGHKDAIWGKVFDNFIDVAKIRYPNLLFKLDMFNGNYWEIYITEKNSKTGQLNQPILNIRANIFGGSKPRIYCFMGQKHVAFFYFRHSKQSSSYVINRPFPKGSIAVQDIENLLLDICRVFTQCITSGYTIRFII